MKKNIAIVENEIIEARHLAVLLTDAGYNVVDVFCTGEKIIKKLRNADLKPDLILMDVFLDDDMTGIAATKIINKEYHIPVIYITANRDIITMQEINKSEYYDFVYKPYDDDKILELIKKALK